MENGILRQLLAIAAFVLLMFASGAPVWAKEPRLLQTLETRPGEMLFVKLPGNPSVGYKWRLNKDLSKGLDLVDVDEIGWLLAQKGRSMFFQKQSVLNVLVSAKTVGQADLVFDYYRRLGGRTYIRKSIVRVVIKPPLVTQ